LLKKSRYTRTYETPERVFEAPANTFVTGFVGSPVMNFVEGRILVEGGASGFAGPGWALPLDLEPVWIGFGQARLHVFDAATRQRLT